MKKILCFFVFVAMTTSLSAMIRARVDVGPEPAPGYYYYDDGYYYNEWYGPGVYYGIYFNDYPTYYAWQRRYYYGGPYYWRHQHRNYEWNHRHHRNHK